MRKHSLLTRLLASMLAIALLPLLLSSVILAINLKRTGSDLAEKTARSTDLQASQNLEMRAREVAGEVARYLSDCESDLRLLTRLPHTTEAILAFSQNRRDEIWDRGDHPGMPDGRRYTLPRYRSITLLDSHGNEVVTASDGKIRSSTAENTVSANGHRQKRFPDDDYFPVVSRLKPGEIYASHLIGYHVSMDEQLNGEASPEEALKGKSYEGYIRLATPLFSKDGKHAGVISLALDHRHLMEFTQHILPGENGTTIFPSYKSGNYAFMFDDEGWIITHPKFWDIRGVSRETGKLVPPFSNNSSTEDINAGRIPFNLDHAGFIHPSYPKAAEMVRQGKSGYLDATNVGGAKKIMAFAPIPYRTGAYGKHGIFGGITIGFQADQFHIPARSVASVVRGHLQKHLGESIAIIGTTTLLVLLCAFFLSGGITRPLALLTKEARLLARGERVTAVKVQSGGEIGELADSFNKMATELEQRKNSLMETMEQLQASRREILAEKDFKENILESISSSILTFSPDGRLTSINGTGRRLLGYDPAPGTLFKEMFSTWSDLNERIEAALSGRHPYGREPLIIGEGASRRHFEIGFFPIGEGGCRGLTFTLRDETERERLRDEMVRMDRLVSLGKISAGIAHEVRNPLTGISLLLDDLHDRLSTSPDIQILTEKALNEIERVEGLVSSLLSYAAPPRPDLKEADLNQTIQDTLMFFRKSCSNLGITLKEELSPLPPVRMDVGKIHQALFNLLKNAQEALTSGGQITVATRTDRNNVCIMVSDTGPGILEEEIPLLFEPFYTGKHTGTGLGLSITQRIVEEHRGTITVASSAADGTTFTICLPIEAGNRT